MFWRWKFVAVVGVVLAFASSFGAASAQSVSPADRAALGSSWHGTWEGSEFVYEADLQLTLSPSNQLDGSIRWTLRRSPRSNEQGKIGLTGVEYVRGAYHPDARLLSFEGYRKDDPDAILGLDKYRLLLSENDKILGGITDHHGSWTARFFLSR